LAPSNADRLDVRTWHNVLIGVSNFLGAAANMAARYQKIKDELEADPCSAYGE
jgi:hypothetical protein